MFSKIHSLDHNLVIKLMFITILYGTFNLVHNFGLRFWTNVFILCPWWLFGTLSL